MLSLIDKLVIAFMYVNVLTSSLSIGGVPVNKALMLFIIFFYALYAVSSGVYVPQRVLAYIFTSLALIVTLATIGLIKGNIPEFIAGFVAPILVLAIIPVFFALFRRYSVERYLKQLLIAILCLSIVIIVIYAISITVRPVGFWINENLENYCVAYREMNLSWMDISKIRVIAKTSAFLPGGLLIAYYCFKRNGSKVYLVAMALIAFSLYLNQTFTVLLAAALSLYALSMTYRTGHYFKLVVGILSILIVVGGMSLFLYKTFRYKADSVGIKSEQVVNALDYFVEKPVLGQGLGYVYRDMDKRGTADPNLEVTYVMILTSTGVVGFLFYCFIYLFYPLKTVLWRNRARILTVLLLSHLAVIVAGAGNPFMLSGGMGLLFVTMLAAAYEWERMEKAVFCEEGLSESCI